MLRALVKDWARGQLKSEIAFQERWTATLPFTGATAVLWPALRDHNAAVDKRTALQIAQKTNMAAKRKAKEEKEAEKLKRRRSVLLVVQLPRKVQPKGRKASRGGGKRKKLRIRV